MSEAKALIPPHPLPRLHIRLGAVEVSPNLTEGTQCQEAVGS